MPSEDLTRKVQYSPNDESVVAVSPAGEITARRAGETAIMVRTLGKAIAARIAVIENPPLKDYPETPRNNFIDDLVFAKLRRLNIVPSPLSSDEEFVRRVYLDMVGLLPSLEETREFLASADPRKRAILIDRLLERPEFAEVWATRFSDLFRVGLLDQGHKGGRLMYTWLRNSIAADKPYNEFATELLTASGNLFFQPTANFYYITEFSEPENIATNISQVFLGVRLECARCHNHPWEKWTQDDFWGFAAFFGRMGIKDTYQNDESQVLLKAKGEVLHPKTKKAVQPKYLDGPGETEGPDEDIREKLAAWMTAPGNPWFARAIVNRVVKHYLGRGLVEPVDDFRVTNPPSNEALLDALAQDFVRQRISPAPHDPAASELACVPAIQPAQRDQSRRSDQLLALLRKAADGRAADRRGLAGDGSAGKISRPDAGHPCHEHSAGRAIVFPADLRPGQGARGDLRARQSAGHGAGHASDQRRDPAASDHGQGRHARPVAGRSVVER